jgi:hypothetical protein
MPRAKNPRRKVLELTRDIKRTVEALRHVWNVTSTVRLSVPPTLVVDHQGTRYEHRNAIVRDRLPHEYPEASLIYWNSLYREAQHLEHMAQELKALAAREYTALENRKIEEVK